MLTVVFHAGMAKNRGNIVSPSPPTPRHLTGTHSVPRSQPVSCVLPRYQSMGTRPNDGHYNKNKFENLTVNQEKTCDLRSFRRTFSRQDECIHYYIRHRRFSRTLYTYTTQHRTAHRGGEGVDKPNDDHQTSMG